MSSEIFENDDKTTRKFKKRKMAKELALQDAATKEKQSIVYMNLKADGMNDLLALQLSGIQTSSINMQSDNDDESAKEDKIINYLLLHICIFHLFSSIMCI